MVHRHTNSYYFFNGVVVLCYYPHSASSLSNVHDFFFFNRVAKSVVVICFLYRCKRVRIGLDEKS